MQFNFNVNEVLKNSIEVIDHNSKLEYYNCHIDLKCVQNLHISQKLSYIIDSMGNASKQAQNLPKVITTSSKLKNSDQRVYLSKEEGLNNGNGEVIGLLKVGYKKLFVYDIQGNQHETKPLCVLDFYVHESKQRQGYGKILFEFMLKNENAEPLSIAIDRPSSKFVSFLAKHYDLVDPVPQANNFVVFAGFFSNNSKDSANYSRHRRNHYSVISPMANGGLHRQQLPSQGPIPEPTLKPSPLSATSRSRPITCNVNLDFNKIPNKTGVNYPEPPMLPRGDNINQYKWYLKTTSPFMSNGNTNFNNITNHRTTTTNNNNNYLTSNNGHGTGHSNFDQHPNSILPKISSNINSTNNNYNVRSEYNLYSGHSTTKSSPNLNCDAKSQLKVPNKTDYNYSLGIARHYSHNRIW